jgi:hypothetical protein
VKVLTCVHALRQVVLNAPSSGGEPPKTFTFDQVYDDTTIQEVPWSLVPRPAASGGASLMCVGLLRRICTTRPRPASSTPSWKVSTALSSPTARRVCHRHPQSRASSATQLPHLHAAPVRRIRHGQDLHDGRRERPARPARHHPTRLRADLRDDRGARRREHRVSCACVVPRDLQ